MSPVSPMVLPSPEELADSRAVPSGALRALVDAVHTADFGSSRDALEAFAAVTVEICAAEAAVVRLADADGTGLTAHAVHATSPSLAAELAGLARRGRTGRVVVAARVRVQRADRARRGAGRLARGPARDVAVLGGRVPPRAARRRRSRARPARARVATGRERIRGGARPRPGRRSARGRDGPRARRRSMSPASRRMPRERRPPSSGRPTMASRRSLPPSESRRRRSRRLCRRRALPSTRAAF